MAGTIQSVKSRQIFDSRGKPTIEVCRTRPSPVHLPDLYVVVRFD